jgi:hypothetical protein
MIERRLLLDRARSLGDIISDSFAFQTPQWRAFAAAAGPAVLLGIILQLLIFVLSPDAGRLENNPTQAEVQAYFEDYARDLAPLLLLIPVIWVIGQLSTAGVVVVLKAMGEGRPVSAGDALDAAQDRAKDLLLASLRSSVILFLLAITIIGLPWAIKKAVQWVFLTQCIMVDGATHRDALKRSEELVRGNWWLTVGRLLAIGILIGLASSTVGGIIQAIVPDVPGILLAGIVGFFTTPYSIIASSLTFFDYRHRKAPAPTPPTAPEDPDEVEAEELH